MQSSLAEALKRALTVGLLCLLAGCSALRLAYDQGPQLAWWWLDGYADFDRDQTPRVKDAIQQWFAWHRTTQLGDYGAWLAALRGRSGESITPADVCRWSDDVTAATAAALDQALVLGAPLAAQLGEAQIRHIEQRYAKGNEDFKGEFMQKRAAERIEAAFKRSVERAETLYGSVDDAQRKLLRTLATESPYDAEGHDAERRRRQRDTVQTLRKLVAERADAQASLAALRGLVERSKTGGDPAYRALQQRLKDYNCAAIARFHATTSAPQRKAAQKRIEGWEEDLRRLQAAPPG